MGERIRRLPFQTGAAAFPDGVLMSIYRSIGVVALPFARLQRRERAATSKKLEALEGVGGSQNAHVAFVPRGLLSCPLNL